MKIIPKSSAMKEAYSKQEERGSFDVPPSGTYFAVNTKLQHQKVGAKKTPKVQVHTHLLGLVEVEDPSQESDAKDWVGQDVRQDLWWDLSKKGNLDRVATMGIACNQMDEWDPEDDKQLARAITGVPYQLKVRRKEEEYQGKKRINMDVVATQLLGPDKRKELASDPDWNKLVGALEDRIIPPKSDDDKPASGGNSRSSGTTTKVQEVDPFADIPFSDGSSKG